MSNANSIYRLEYLADLIRRKATGSPRELAEKVGVSERTIYDLINTLKELEGPISYDADRRTYYFRKQGDFRFRFRFMEKK
jgi:predicted DNA-binding transcriptional regulator YafY